MCVLDGVEYEEDSHWQPDTPCSTCSCLDGEIVCTHTQCPPVACLHPTRSKGTCVCVCLFVWVCARESEGVCNSFPLSPSLGSCCAACESCSFNQRIYRNGQTFSTPDRPCQTCSCVVRTDLKPPPGPIIGSDGAAALLIYPIQFSDLQKVIKGTQCALYCPLRMVQ